MATKTNNVTNCNVYVQDKSFLGMAEEVTLPDVQFTLTEHKALGMIGIRQLPNGVDKMEGKIKWNSFYPEVFKQFANPFKGMKVMVRTSVRQYESGDLVDEKALVVYLTIQPKKMPLGGFKPNEPMELETEFVCSYCKVEFDGQLLMEVDTDNNIYNVDGTDLLVKYRQNLGI